MRFLTLTRNGTRKDNATKRTINEIHHTMDNKNSIKFNRRKKIAEISIFRLTED